jgi:DNA-binding CsgD family transcriptional regulator
MSDDDMRTIKHEVHTELEKAKIRAAKRLKEGGYSNAEIAEHMDISENSVRLLLEK